MVEENKKSIVIPDLIVGLGNPEPKYDHTRHNIGFAVVDYLADKWGFTWQKNNKFNALFTEGFAPNRKKVRLVKPFTYMNNSGQSVRAVLDWYKLTPETLLVVYDDMDLPLGKIRLRLSGSAGGHNGMKSIISHVGGQKFPRCRIGIGKSGEKQATIGHVLGRFSSEETPVINDLMVVVRGALELSLHDGVEKTMSLYN
ncbi:MAG: aminoacyl-tRNA hydrolase [Cyanobacterium sp. T60_A2020_053]|nr:aminoacyl-tRNA hydrolase [Cyanobacterium sp. T60_A2020_053]